MKTKTKENKAKETTTLAVNTYRDYSQARSWIRERLTIDLELLGVTGIEIVVEIDEEKTGQQKAHGYFRAGKSHYDIKTGKGLVSMHLTAETLDRPYWEVRETVRHEAVHVANWFFGVKDNSNGGRFHNKHFKSRAISVGLDVGPRNGSHGFNLTSLSAVTLEIMKVEEPEDPNGVSDLAKYQNPKAEPRPKKAKTLVKWGLLCEHSSKVAYITPKDNFDNNPCMHCGQEWELIG